MAVTVNFNEPPFYCDLETDYPITFTVPSKASNKTWYSGQIKTSGELIATGLDFAVERIHDGTISNMHLVGAGEIVGTEHLEDSTWTSQVCDAWQGMQTGVDPIYGTNGQIWDAINSLGNSGGGTLNLNYRLEARNNAGINDGYWINERAYTATGSGNVSNVQIVIQEDIVLAPDPLLQYIALKVSFCQDEKQGLMMTVNRNSYTSSSSGNSFLIVNVYRLSTIKTLIDSYTIFCGDIHEQGQVGVIHLPTGRTILAYEDMDRVKKYYYSDNFGLGGSEEWTTVPWNSPGGLVNIPILERTGCWTEMSSGMAWKNAGVIQSVEYPGGIAALTACASGGVVELGMMYFKDQTGAMNDYQVVQLNVDVGDKSTDTTRGYKWVESDVACAGIVYDGIRSKVRYKLASNNGYHKTSGIYYWDVEPVQDAGSESTGIGYLARGFDRNVAVTIPPVFGNEDKFFYANYSQWEQINTGLGTSYYDNGWPAWFMSDRYKVAGSYTNTTIFPTPQNLSYSNNMGRAFSTTNWLFE